MVFEASPKMIFIAAAGILATGGAIASDLWFKDRDEVAPATSIRLSAARLEELRNSGLEPLSPMPRVRASLPLPIVRAAPPETRIEPVKPTPVPTLPPVTRAERREARREERNAARSEDAVASIALVGVTDQDGVASAWLVRLGSSDRELVQKGGSV